MEHDQTFVEGQPAVATRSRSRFAPSLGALLLVLLLAGCATAPAPAPRPAPEPEPVAEAEIPPGLHWVRSSAEHRAVYVQTYRDAAEELEKVVEGRAPFTWAVSLDADETLLDNSLYQKERAEKGLGYTPESWNEWVRRGEAPALPGTRDFLETVRGLGGKIAVVTNRDEIVCPETEANLRAERLPYDVVLCQPMEGPSSKEPRWEAVETGQASRSLPPLDLVMWIGDNIHDFPGGSQEMAHGPERELEPFGRIYFVLPNPMYGSWQDNPVE